MMEKERSYKQTSSENKNRGFSETNHNREQQNETDQLIQSEKMRYKNADQIYE
ncbi:hypothetical protein SAMN05192533_13215 [Mesobacillus persicus]|uniref:Uncharacterized protein n=1 Tax=Mesobacillus persicus TaxID=930146 RepID=A0A1H8KUJ7_9BACI|nr:hypothetical protein [Mesobacillus persicus]SEN96491.1 hypothetical protein SAMN05192533_13215 [Mesobacillus persicus]